MDRTKQLEKLEDLILKRDKLYQELTLVKNRIIEVNASLEASLEGVCLKIGNNYYRILEDKDSLLKFITVSDKHIDLYENYNKALFNMQVPHKVITEKDFYNALEETYNKIKNYEV